MHTTTHSGGDQPKRVVEIDLASDASIEQPSSITDIKDNKQRTPPEYYESDDTFAPFE